MKTKGYNSRFIATSTQGILTLHKSCHKTLFNGKTTIYCNKNRHIEKEVFSRRFTLKGCLKRIVRQMKYMYGCTYREE